jgi:hypothetical protein
MFEIVLNKFELLNLRSNNLMSNDKIKNKINLKKTSKKKIKSIWINLANSLHIKWDSDKKN